MLFECAGHASTVLKSKQEPEVNFAEVLKALGVRTILEVVGVQFCRVKWTGDNNGAAAKTVALGSCIQHSQWDRNAKREPSGSVAPLQPWLEKARNDTLWASVPIG